MERPVDTDLADVAADDPVQRQQTLCCELVEHASVDPLVATGAQAVSDTRRSKRASMLTHEEPVVRRIMIPQKHNQIGTRGR